jgi:hypothetical protein
VRFAWPNVVFGDGSARKLEAQIDESLRQRSNLIYFAPALTPVCQRAKASEANGSATFQPFSPAVHLLLPARSPTRRPFSTTP